MTPTVKQKNHKLQATKPTDKPAQATLPTFLDHIRELRRRLFWVVGFIFVVSFAAFPFQQQLINILTKPLGPEKLYYTTPVGGLAFILKLCMFVGVVVAIPLIIYHLYRYLEPLMTRWRTSVLLYVVAASGLAACGILFAYFVSLPGALHFLTNFNIQQVKALLTVDSYLSFVITYLLTAALLFQIPLVMLIIGGIKPMPPRKLMKSQRFVILGSFLLAAVISPTPDMLNQFLFALPIIGMYEVGVVLVIIQQRSRRKKTAPVVVQSLPPAPKAVIPKEVLQELRTPAPKPQATMQPLRRTVPRPIGIDGVRPPSTHVGVPQPRPVAAVPHGAQRPAPAPRVAVMRKPGPLRVPQRSMDGMVVRAPFSPAS